MKKGVDYIGVGVGTLIVKKNRILLLKRLCHPERNKWSIPGGRVELGEKIEDAAIREAAEEIGVKIKIHNLIGVANHIDGIENNHWVAPIFFAKIIEGVAENKEPSLHEEMKWFSMKNIPDNLTIMTTFALEKYKKYSAHGMEYII